MITRKLGEPKRHSMGDFCVKRIDLADCQNFVREIFRDENVLENFKELNKKYGIINFSYRVLLSN